MITSPRFGLMATLVAVLTASPKLWAPLVTPVAHRDPVPAPLPPQTLERLDGTRLRVDSADALVRTLMKSHRITGMQVAVVNHGKLVWSSAHGTRALGDGAGSAALGPSLPMQRSTTTWAASITKAVFATYVMQLVEQGQFSLDIPVARQLSTPLNEYAAYRDKASQLVQDSMWARVTPRMLLSHTSGLANFATFEPDGLMRLHDEPGTRYRYSGEGINLLGFLIEQQRGARLDQLMHDALFMPLGMTRTSLVYRESFRNDIADRFGAQEQFLSTTRRAAARAAGSMTSNAEDIATFAVALMNGRILRRDTRDAMLAPQVRITARAQFGPLSLTDDSEETRKVGLAYGMGWGLLTRTAHGPAFFKEGHGDGAQTYVLCFSRQQSCVVLMANSDNGEFAFRPLVNTLLGTDDVPWFWEGYTPEQIREAQRQP